MPGCILRMMFGKIAKFLLLQFSINLLVSNLFIYTVGLDLIMNVHCIIVLPTPDCTCMIDP